MTTSTLLLATYLILCWLQCNGYELAQTNSDIFKYFYSQALMVCAKHSR